MKLNQIIKECRFDKRIVEWGLRHHLINAQEYQEHLKALPDLVSQKKDIQDGVEESVQTSQSEGE